MDTINREELRTKIEREDDFVLVEAGPEEHYQEAHLPGAVLFEPVSLEEIGRVAASLLPGKGTEVVVYCRNLS